MQSEADVRRILDNIKFKNEPTWIIHLGRDDTRFYVQIQNHEGKCNTTGEPMAWHGRKWLLSPHMTETEVVRTAHKAFLAAIEHEANESFTYKDVTVYDPHIDIRDLVYLRRTTALDAREEPHA